MFIDHVVMEYTTLLLYLLSLTWIHSCNFPPHLRLDISLLESEGVRLVINQSVWIQWSEVYTRRLELSIC